MAYESIDPHDIEIRDGNFTAMPAKKDGWASYRETENKGIHRLWLTHFVSRATTGHVYWFRLRSEGRSNLKLRLADANQNSRYVEVKFDADIQDTKQRSNEYGFICASIVVDSERVSTIAVCVDIYDGSLAELQLISQPTARTRSSSYAGNPAVGFAIADPLAIDLSTFEVDIESEAALLQLDTSRPFSLFLSLIHI